MRKVKSVLFPFFLGGETVDKGKGREKESGLPLRE